MQPKYYGKFGGVFVPEILMLPIQKMAQAFAQIKTDERFQKEWKFLLEHYAGRPTPVTFARNLSKVVGRRIFLKREDLLHGGAHKTNNTIGQGLIAKTMGKKRLICETGAGQHGVATAMIGALLGVQVEVYMGRVDVARQQANVKRMKLFGATVHSVDQGSGTLKDAINEAMRDWFSHVEDTFYVFGTAVGPHPFPEMVKYFQSVIGLEARAQMLELTGALPDVAIACVGGGSNAIGLFNAFLDDKAVDLIGAEAAGYGLASDYHAATLSFGTEGIFHGMRSLFLQNEDGQITETHSISAGLDYPGVGPEHAYLKESGRVIYKGVTDEEALNAFRLIAEREGILAAMESSHALALAFRIAKDYPENAAILVNISGRGDKDIDLYNEHSYSEF